MRPLVSLVFAAATLALAHDAPAQRGSGPGPEPEPRGASGPLLASLRRGKRSEDKGGRVLRYSLKEQEVNGTKARRKQRRTPQTDDGWTDPPDYTSVDKWNWKDIEDFRGFAYFMEVDIGDPVQSVSLVPDTGSFETWVNPNCQDSMTSNRLMCLKNKHYYPEESELARYLDENETWSFKYGTGSAEGKYVEDRFYYRHEDVVVRQKFGLATNSTHAVAGILGLGYGYGYTMDYYNVLDTLVLYNFINAPIFSVSLGKIGEGLSEIVFGGINRSRFSGHLTPVPVWPSVFEQPVGWVHYWVRVTSFAVDFGNGKSSTYFKAKDESEQINAMVDTGSTWSFLPHEVVDKIIDEMGAWEEVGEWKVGCDYRDTNGTANFGFNNDELIVQVPLSDFIFQLQDGTCVLGVQKRDSADDDSMLGATFLRGSYTVYDQLTHSVWMGNYKKCGIESQVDEVGRYQYDVGDIEGLC